MKLTIVFLFLAGLFYGQDCGCVENFKNNHWLKYPQIFITNSKIQLVKNDFEIRGNCVEIIRMYLNDVKGEYEKEGVSCVSKKYFNLKLNSNTMLYFVNSKNQFIKFRSTTSKVNFLKKLLKDKRNPILKLELNEEGNEIREISQRSFLEN